METKIELLLKQLTLTEKVSLLAGADMWHTGPVERLGIPAMKMSDGPNGVRGADDNLGPTSVCFPVGVALGATWNPDLIKQVGGALAETAKDKGAHILLAPTVNIQRTPIAGRNFECFAEDPYLSGQMAAAYIEGLQSHGVGACIKHFVCNDQEFERFSISAQVEQRPLHEIYLEPFRIALQQARPWTIMSAYNRINGRHASENSALLLDILKDKWGFDGLVTSDWYGTYSDHVAAGGLDLEMPGPARWMGQNVHDAVDNGELSETVLDDKVRRLLRTMMRVGIFDQPQRQTEHSQNRPEDRQLARAVAGEAIVLLKNESDLLPLDPNKPQCIAVIGENAKWAQIHGGGSSAVNFHYAITPLDGIKSQTGEGVQVDYAIGCPLHKYPPLLDVDWLTTGPQNQRGLTVDFFDNLDLTGEPTYTAVTQKTMLSWFGTFDKYIDPTYFSLRLSGFLQVPLTGEYKLHLLSMGKSRLLLDGVLHLDNWVEEEIAEGTIERDGQAAAVTLPLEAGQRYELVVEFSCDPRDRSRMLRLGCPPLLPDDPIVAAVELAAKADVAVIFAGLTSEWESEGYDRLDLELVGQQNELIERVTAVNPRTIVVLNAGSPLTMPWLEKIPAVLQMWYPGQEGGNAIADVLFGARNPSGHLPLTFPRRLQDNPAYINYPGENGKVFYGEGIFVGYRYYDKKGIEPLFPFGFGLSYTTFDYANLCFNKAVFGSDDNIVISLDVTNRGARAGQTVVQVYVHDEEARVLRPSQELKAFAKVALEAGETQTVTLKLDQQALAFWDTAVEAWVTEPGMFELLVGSSSRDIRLRGKFEWVGNV